MVPLPDLGQGGRGQGARQPGHQHRSVDVVADVGDPDLDRGVARGAPRDDVDAPLVQGRAAGNDLADSRVVGGRVRSPGQGRDRPRHAGADWPRHTGAASRYPAVPRPSSRPFFS